MYKAKMRCVALLIIMLSMVSCGQNRQELSVLPLNIEELKDYPVYVLDWQSRECSGAELLDEFYEQTSENQPAQLVIVHYLVSEELVTARCISIP